MEAAAGLSSSGTAVRSVDKIVEGRREVCPGVVAGEEGIEAGVPSEEEIVEAVGVDTVNSG